jgi:hypothetical protein
VSDLKKFLFDLNDFDEEAVAKKLAEEEPPLPSFSEEELEQEKAEAFQKGRLNGIDEERNNILEKTHNTLTDFPRALNDLLAQETQRQEQFINDSIAMTLDALKKSFPNIYDLSHVNDLKTALTKYLKHEIDGNSLLITVNEELRKPIEEHIQQLGVDNADKIQVKGAKDLASGHMNIKWDHGGAIWSPTNIHEKIIDILQTNIGEDYAPTLREDEEIAPLEETSNQADTQDSQQQTSDEALKQDVTIDDKEKTPHNGNEETKLAPSKESDKEEFEEAEEQIDRSGKDQDHE